jgi:hypothetical protein
MGLNTPTRGATPSPLSDRACGSLQPSRFSRRIANPMQAASELARYCDARATAGPFGVSAATASVARRRAAPKRGACRGENFGNQFNVSSLRATGSG